MASLRSTLFVILLLSFSMISLKTALAETSLPLVIKVDGFRNGNGFLAISLFSKSEARAFPSNEKKAIRTFYVPLDGKKEISIPIEDLPAGEYAVSVMHDENADRKMHFNLIGIPVEGFGFSNNPTIYFGPPSFRHAKIQVKEAETKIAEPVEIKMKYFL